MEIARAARLVEHGAPLVVEDVQLAGPGDDEVLVEMAYGGVNPVDRYNALGRVSPELALPRTLGSEGAGYVVTGGERRPVFLNRSALLRPGDGLWATRVVVRQQKLIDVPDGLDLAVAASVGVAGVTAWRCVAELGEASPGDRVLVLGASGGVGSVAVSVAKRLGAEVVGQTGSHDKVDFVRDRGADRVVVGDAARLVEALRDWKPTLVIDPLGGAFTGAGIELLEQRGRLVIFGASADASGAVPLQSLYRKGITVKGYAGLIEPAEAIEKGVRASFAALRDGRMEIVVDSLIPLEQVNDAFERLAERGVSGKLVLDLSR